MKTDGSDFSFIGRSTLTAVAADRSLYNNAFLCGDAIFIGCGCQPRGFMCFDGNTVFRADGAKLSIGDVRACGFGCEAFDIVQSFVCGVSFVLMPKSI